MWFYLVLFCVVHRVESIKMKSIHVPEKVPWGQEVQLHCIYDLEGDKLYSLNWQKDKVEFFRYTPSQNPPKQFFPLQGIHVNMARSGNGTVVIENVVANTTGTFGCEASAEVTFHTVKQERFMEVQGTSFSKFTLNVTESSDDINGCCPKSTVAWNVFGAATVLSLLFSKIEPLRSAIHAICIVVVVLCAFL